MPGQIEHHGGDDGSNHLAPDAPLPAEAVVQKHPAPKAEHRYDKQIGIPGAADGQPTVRVENSGDDRNEAGASGQEHGGISEGRIMGFHRR